MLNFWSVINCIERRNLLYLCRERNTVQLVETGGQGGRGLIAPQILEDPLTLFIATGGQIMPTTLLLTPSRLSDLPTALQEVQEKAIQLSKKISRQRCYIRAECSLLKRRKEKKSAISLTYLEPSMKEH